MRIDQYPAPRIPRRKIGQYFSNGNVVSTAVQTASSLRAIPFIVYNPTAESFDRIAIEITVTGGVGKVIRAGIYNTLDQNTSYPSSLIVDSGALDAENIGIKESVISVVLKSGLYWLATLTDGTPTLRAFIPNDCSDILGMTTITANRSLCWLVATAYGALPTTFTVGGSIAITATTGVWLRKSA
jgi:hypothetical protein